MRAKALSIVRVSDRDAGGSEVPTVARPIHETECPPASPISRSGAKHAIHDHRSLEYGFRVRRVAAPRNARELAAVTPA